MNCFNHVHEPAVASCSDCGKGLCYACSSQYEPILCTPCFQARRKREKWHSVLSLLPLLVLFVIGFEWDFMRPYARWVSGYTLMALWAGYLFIERFIPYKKFAGSLLSWAMYYLIKAAACAVIGIFTLPFVFVMAILRVIKAFR